MPLTVLIVAGGGFQGEALAHSIRALPDARVLVADSIADNLGRSFADRYVVCPPMADAAKFAACIETLVAEEQVDLVLPCVSFGLKQLAALRPRIEAAGAVLGLSSEALLDVLLDKKQTYEALLEASIPAQRPVALTQDAPLPLCGKPRDGWGGRDLIVLKTQEQLARLDTSHANSHCWVPWLSEFEEFSADFAIDAARAISPITLRLRVRTSGGFAVISDSRWDDGVLGVVLQTATWLAKHGGCGIFNVQVLRHGDVLYVSDINPRHGTSATHASAEGNLLVPFILGRTQHMSRRAVRSMRSLQQTAIPLHPSSRWRGVVFDLDDTLIDQKHWIMQRIQSAAHALAPADPDPLMRHAYAVVEEGRYEYLIDILAERLAPQFDRDALLAAYREAKPGHARVFPEVGSVLRNLRDAGIRIGLLTDNPPASQQAKLDAMGDIASLFDAVVFARDCGAEKPDRRGFQVIAEKLDLPPDQLLMVGDNVSRDAMGAIAAGYDACLILDRPGVRHRLNEALAAQYLPDVWQKCWTASDLRSLPMACGIPANAPIRKL